MEILFNQTPPILKVEVGKICYKKSFFGFFENWLINNWVNFKCVKFQAHPVTYFHVFHFCDHLWLHGHLNEIKKKYDNHSSQWRILTLHITHYTLKVTNTHYALSVTH